MSDLILTNNKTIIQADNTNDVVENYNTQTRSVVGNTTIYDTPTSGIVVTTDNPIVTKEDEIIPNTSGTVLTSKEAIINRLVEYYDTIPGAALVINNCIFTGENNIPRDVYSKDEIQDILTNYFNKDQVLELLTNLSSITGEMFDFYLDGLNLTVNKPTSTTQISFNIDSNNSITRVFTIRLTNSFIVHTGALFNLWVYLNGLSLSTSYNVKTTLHTISRQKISEGYFNLKPSTMYELFVVPMNTNFLLNSVNLSQEELLQLEITISKDTSFPETISIVSGPNNLSRLTINNNQLTANNIFDYKEGNTYSQSKLNNSIIWEKF